MNALSLVEAVVAVLGFVIAVVTVPDLAPVIVVVVLEHLAPAAIRALVHAPLQRVVVVLVVVASLVAVSVVLVAASLPSVPLVVLVVAVAAMVVGVVAIVSQRSLSRFGVTSTATQSRSSLRRRISVDQSQEKIGVERRNEKLHNVLWCGFPSS